MSLIYIDPIVFQCHTDQNAENTLIPYEEEYFDGKCQTFIEGYRCVPSGEIWTRSDGIAFIGKMIAPWKNYNELAAAQSQYEADMVQLQTAYQEGVNSV